LTSTRTNKDVMATCKRSSTSTTTRTATKENVIVALVVATSIATNKDVVATSSY
jgi:hypothetical protein